MDTLASMLSRAQGLPRHETEALSAELRASLWSNAARVAGNITTAIHGPRPEAKWPTPNDSLGMAERDRDFGERMAVFTEAKIAQEKWDRRHRALTRALATEARCIEDRAEAGRLAA